MVVATVGIVLIRIWCMELDYRVPIFSMLSPILLVFTTTGCLEQSAFWRHQYSVILSSLHWPCKKWDAK